MGRGLGETMEHKEQVRVLRGLMDQLDAGKNIDAGKQVMNPAINYLCTDRAEQEWKSFFQDYPQVLGLSDDLPEANSFFTSDEMGTPILCTRDKEGEFHAFINSCRHRGTIVETEERGKRTAFSCPFHAWTYNAKGDLVSIPRQDDFGEVDKSCYSLVELPAEEKHGILWIHPNPNAELNLDDNLGDLGAELASWKLETMTRDAATEYPHEMNWKLAIDTFGETYHFNVLHKNTLAQTFYAHTTMYDTYKRNHRMSLCQRGIDTLRDKPESEWDILIGALPAYYLFPNVQLLMTQAGPVLVRVYPRGANPNDSYSKVTFYLRPEIAQMKGNLEFAEMSDAISERLQGFGNVIRDEDYAAAATSHKGLSSGHIDHVIYGRNEPALHHYHNTYQEALGLPPLEEV